MIRIKHTKALLISSLAGLSLAAAPLASAAPAVAQGFGHHGGHGGFGGHGCGFRRKPATHSDAKPASVPI